MCWNTMIGSTPALLALASSVLSHASILVASSGTFWASFSRFELSTMPVMSPDAEGVVIGTEVFAVAGERFVGRLILHIVITRHVVEA